MRRSGHTDRLWLCRDSIGLPDYLIYRSVKPIKGYVYREGRWLNSSLRVCSMMFEASTPESCHLKPGGGPIEIKISRVRNSK